MLQRFGQACAIIFVACCQSHLNRQQEGFLAPSSHKHRHRQRAVIQDRAGVSERRTLIRMLRVLVLIFDLSRVSASLGLDESLGWPSLPTQIVPLAFVIARRFVLRLHLIPTISNYAECVSLCRPGVESSGWGRGCGRKRRRSSVFWHTLRLCSLHLLEVTCWDFPLLFFTCLGMMDAVLFLFSVPFAQKQSGKGNPLLWWGNWLDPKGKYLHDTWDPWTVLLHKHCTRTLWSLSHYPPASVSRRWSSSTISIISIVFGILLTHRWAVHLITYFVKNPPVHQSTAPVRLAAFKSLCYVDCAVVTFWFIFGPGVDVSGAAIVKSSTQETK